MDPLAVAVGAHALGAARTVATPDPAVAAALTAAGIPTTAEPLAGATTGSFDALALIDDELSRAGEHAEGLLAEAARVLRPGGLLAVTAVSAAFAIASARSIQARAFTAAELARVLGHAGFGVTGQWAPGAASRLGGRASAFDPEADRTPGLLDAAPTVAAVARRYVDARARERVFFSSLPRKVVAAAVICRDTKGRVLIVHDAFKRHWTIPGGVVDADEDPRAGAARETREETGIAVEVARLLGVFAMSWPDRLLLVFEARPAGDEAPRPVHAHEIDAAEWADLDEALGRLDARIASQVRRCLATPGGTWAD